MNTIKIKSVREIPKGFTGIVKLENGDSFWYKNKRFHREDGPAKIWTVGYKEWWLDGKRVWESGFQKLILKNKIILSKEIHPEYSTCQVWKYIDGNGIREQVMIPEMEEWFIE